MSAAADAPPVDADACGAVSGAPSAPAPRLGIVNSMFPELHETFILRELVALERRGVDFDAATRHLVDAGHDVRVVIVGEGPCRADIEACIAEHGLEDVVTLAGVRSDVPDVLAAPDLFVLSSDREGDPLAALEAQAARTPVVLTRAAGNVDAIASEGDMTGGVLADPDAGSLADAIAALVVDPGRLTAMSTFAPAHALEHFDTRHMVARYAAALG